MLCFWEKFSLWNASTQPIKLVVEEISRNKRVVQTPITYFINQKEKHMSIWHNSILTWIKSDAPFFRIDIIYMIYFDVKHFSVVSQYSMLETCCKNYSNKGGTFLGKEVKCLSLQHNFCLSDKNRLRLPTLGRWARSSSESKSAGTTASQTRFWNLSTISK